MDKGERLARFTIGEAFPAEDSTARYVVRLAMATGDLALAADAFISRGDDLADYERFYYVRLLAGHLRESIMLIDPPDHSVVPRLDDFLGTFGDAVPQLQLEIRENQRELRETLDAPLTARPDLTLREELKRLRNQFFHYNWEARDDPKLESAIRAAGEIEGVIRERPGFFRALYADEIANHLMHPFAGADAEFEVMLLELHRAILALLGKVIRFARRVEALYLLTRPSGVVSFERSHNI